MTAWIRWWGLGLFAAIVLLWWLSIDAIIKFAIESVGTEAMGAKVEINAVNFSLLPTALSITDLQITNPELPMENIVSSDLVSFQLDSLMLLRQQFIADQATISGLQFNTKRKTSGAIDGRTFSKDGLLNTDSLSLSNIPGLSLPNPDQLIAEEKAHLKKEVDDISNNLKGLEEKWRTRIDELPDDEKLDAYKKRWKVTKKKNWLEKLSGIKSLKDDIGKDLNTISQLDEQLANDLKIVKRELERAKALPAKEADRLLDKAGLSTTSEGIAQAIMSGQLKQWLQQSVNLIKQTSGSMDDESTATDPNLGDSQWVAFAEQEPLPKTLIRHLAINGVIAIAGQEIPFSGNATDLSHQPTQWHKPAKFSLKGEGIEGGLFSAEGVIDHRTALQDTIHLNIANLTMNDFPLSSDDKLSVAMNKARGNIQADLALTDTDIVLHANSQFKQVVMHVDNKSDSKTSLAIANALTGIKDFDLALSVSGNLQDPKIKLKSDLDKILGQAIGNVAKLQAKGLKETLQKKLSAELSPELKGITQQVDFFNGLEGLLADKESSIKALSKGLL